MRRAGALAGLLLLGCEDLSYRAIGGDINVLTKRTDALVPPAMQRLTRHGRRALPQIEIALHTASTDGRLHLIQVLDKIGDPEAIPILRHFAVHDAKPEVRDACERVLKSWSQPSDARAEKAREALARVTAKRAKLD